MADSLNRTFQDENSDTKISSKTTGIFLIANFLEHFKMKILIQDVTVQLFLNNK